MTYPINTNKGIIGMYNSSNPFINSSLKSELTLIITNYFTSKEKSIHESIQDNINTKFESVLSQQNLKLSDIRNTLDDIHTNYISSLNLDEMNQGINEEIQKLTNEFNQMTSNCEMYSHLANDVNRKLNDKNINIGYIDQTIKEVDNAIELLEKITKEEEIKDIELYQIHLDEKIKSIQNLVEFKDDIEMYNYENISNKLENGLKLAREKINNTNNNKNETNTLNTPIDNKNDISHDVKKKSSYYNIKHIPKFKKQSHLFQ
jgi:hypothetical protein